MFKEIWIGCSFGSLLKVVKTKVLHDQDNPLGTRQREKFSTFEELGGMIDTLKAMRRKVVNLST